MKTNTDYVKWARGIISTAPEDRACMVAEDPSVLDVCGLALDQLEAELAALRRVEAEDLGVTRSIEMDVIRRHLPGAKTWAVERPNGDSGEGETLTEALADYDAKKEPPAC